VLAAGIERLRYRGYELERRMAITVRAKDRLSAARLYVIVTESLCRGDWFETARAALDGRADCLQLREKGLSDRELLERVKRLVDLCHERGKMLIVNDRPDIAAAAGADGVHLGQGDLPVAAARRILPTTAIVGVSTHTIEQIESAADQAPDYIAVGPMFATPTKPQERIAGPATLAAARRMTAVPLVAIGGIDLSNAVQVLQAAPCILCICHAAVASPDVRVAVAALCALIGRPPVS
jgi:thiamine-phosphate pyrophosphorylase